MMKSSKINIFWLRRDLRWDDNTALFHALQSDFQIMPIFIFDTDILTHLPEDDKRVTLIFRRLQEMNIEFPEGKIRLYYGKPMEIWQKLTTHFDIAAVYFNHDYEPKALKRDQEVCTYLGAKNIQFFSYKDQCIFEKSTIIKDNGEPYTVFTPYKNKWRNLLQSSDYKEFKYNLKPDKFLKTTESLAIEVSSLSVIGFVEQNFLSPSINIDHISEYEKNRDFPAIEGTSKVSVALRFGMLSVRELVRYALQKNAQKWLDELIWREFYMMILFHFPHTVQQSFKPQYDRIQWRNDENEFQRWCEGKTGFPLVDAGMRELNQTGWMHNRVRMVAASFLCKHLLIDWRWGEAYFAQKLLDYEQSSNVGGWQWVCGSGNDAAPYFRVFNPMLQHKKFDPENQYIKYWVPEWQDLGYRPMLDHDFARIRCLEVFKSALHSLG